MRQDVWPICSAYALVGLSFGAIASAHGVPGWVVPALSFLVFGGSAQFAALGIVMAGGGALAAVLAGLVINARLIAHSLAMRDRIGRGWPALWRGHLLTDVNTALALRFDDESDRQAIYDGSGWRLFAVWVISAIAGQWLAGWIGDTRALGLDAVLPAILLALIRPQLADPVTRRCALAGGVLALIVWPVVPPGVPVLIALSGCLLAWPTGKPDRAARP